MPGSKTSAAFIEPCCFSELSDCGYSVHQRIEADLNEVAGATADLSIPVV
jgi:hypothetical protein